MAIRPYILSERCDLRRIDKEVTDREEVEELLSNALVGRLRI